jgi:formylglycine-generating enzyme required for sulfatase activity
MLRTGTSLALIALVAGVLNWGTGPQDRVELVPVILSGQSLQVAPFEVTVADWSACVAGGACEDIATTVDNPAVTPMTGVNWFDIAAYITWYNNAHGTSVRLPTAQEWRDFSRKPAPVARKPLFDDPRLAWAANYGQEETPRGPVRVQGSWPKTRDGIADLDGNVWEWTSSCAANDAGIDDPAHCPAMTVMGAHESVIPVFVRDPASGGCATGTPPTHVGFRLVEDQH